MPVFESSASCQDSIFQFENVKLPQQAVAVKFGLVPKQRPLAKQKKGLSIVKILNTLNYKQKIILIYSNFSRFITKCFGSFLNHTTSTSMWLEHEASTALLHQLLQKLWTFEAIYGGKGYALTKHVRCSSQNDETMAKHCGRCAALLRPSRMKLFWLFLRVKIPKMQLREGPTTQSTGERPLEKGKVHTYIHIYLSMIPLSFLHDTWSTLPGLFPMKSPNFRILRYQQHGALTGNHKDIRSPKKIQTYTLKPRRTYSWIKPKTTPSLESVPLLICSLQAGSRSHVQVALHIIILIGIFHTSIYRLYRCYIYIIINMCLKYRHIIYTL